MRYCENTGIYTWKHPTSNRVKVGDKAGYSDSKGYVRFTVGNKSYLAHRLAWLFVHGYFPKGQIDHLNGVKTDNRIANLSDVSHRGNQSNQRKHRLGHIVGTTFNKRLNKWQAKITLDGKQKHLGYYHTQEQAGNAYKSALYNHSFKAQLSTLFSSIIIPEASPTLTPSRNLEGS